MSSIGTQTKRFFKLYRFKMSSVRGFLICWSVIFRRNKATYIPVFTYIWGILGSIKGLSMVKMNELFLKKPKVLSKLFLSSSSFIEPFFHLLTDFNHRSIFGKVKFTSVSNPSDGNIWVWQWERDQGRPGTRRKWQ